MRGTCLPHSLVDRCQRLQFDPPSWLDRTQIRSGNLRQWIQIRHFNGPDARSRATVQYPVFAAIGALTALRRLRDGRQMQAIVGNEIGPVVLHVLALHLLLVVGKVVLALLEGMIASTVLPFVGRHAGGEGRQIGRRAIGLGVGAVVFEIVVDFDVAHLGRWGGERRRRGRHGLIVLQRCLWKDGGGGEN